MGSGQGWFGESWGAPCCEPADHVATPVGRKCLHCSKPIEATDQGFVSPYVRSEDGTGKGSMVSSLEPTHLDCFLAAILPCKGCPNCQPERFH